jgi:hypothetical protein
MGKKPGKKQPQLVSSNDFLFRLSTFWGGTANLFIRDESGLLRMAGQIMVVVRDPACVLMTSVSYVGEGDPYWNSAPPDSDYLRWPLPEPDTTILFKEEGRSVEATWTDRRLLGRENWGPTESIKTFSKLFN